MKDVPDYIAHRIRQRQPTGIRIVSKSTPVVAFGDVLKAEVATLGLNPSKHEFLNSDGNELMGIYRRLETLTSVGENDLVNASDEVVRRIFQGCNNYFHRRPYHWFNKLERLLKHVGTSYYDGSACHLDLVQWATDPVWRNLSPSCRTKLIDADVCFLEKQIWQEKVRLLLLNGRGVIKECERSLGVKFLESPVPGYSRVKLFRGSQVHGVNVVGWNLNVQANFGVSNAEIDAIGAAVRVVAHELCE